MRVPWRSLGVLLTAALAGSPPGAAALTAAETALARLEAARQTIGPAATALEDPAHRWCGTPLVVQAAQAGPGLDQDGRRRLAKLLSRPLLAASVRSPAGHFRIHYDIVGRDAVSSTDADTDGLPDYVEAVTAVLDSVWDLQVEVLGYRSPPSDGSLGGGPEYDVYLRDLGTSYFGWAYPEQSGATSYSHLELDNDYATGRTSGLDALRVTAAHEFFHAVQFGYYRGVDGSWWQEASATWMEEVAYPAVDDYLYYLPGFLSRPERALDSGPAYGADDHAYGAALFAHYLDQRYTRQAVRSVWERWVERASASIDEVDYALRAYDGEGLRGILAGFAVWNYFTGTRHRPGYYREGDRYPEVRPHELQLDPYRPKVPAETADQVDHLASSYLRLRPGALPGGLTLAATTPRGRWRRQVLLIAPDSVEVTAVTGEATAVTGWDRFDEVVLVLTEEDLTGSGYGYTVSAAYDPALTEPTAPLALRLKQNRPNPFRPVVHSQTVFPFVLDRASAVTRLSLFTADGQMVRRFELGARPRRADTQAWDGRNQDGVLVASGVYYAVLEADGRWTVCPLALLRE